MKDFAGYTGGGVPDDLLKEAQAAAAQFDGKNESELIRSIYARAAEGKRAGTLTNEQIAGKRKKLMKLAAELKKM